MSPWYALFLGILQGLTEFIPVSSSGHLLLAEKFLNLPIADDKFFDVVLHLGTSLALILYFWKDWWSILKSFCNFLRPNKDCVSQDFNQAKLGYYIIIGTLPAALIGLAINDYIDEIFRNTIAVSIFLILVGSVFLVAERPRPFQKFTSSKALVIGIAQAIALIPGISRSGSTISAGMLQGLRRDQAASFSFMLGLPAILGAGLLSFLETDVFPEWKLVIIGFISSALTSFFAIKYMLLFLRKHSLHVFAYYLFCVGTLGLVLSLIL